MTEYLCDAVVQTRMDRRTLATIALWMQKKSYRPATRSDMIRLALECFEKVIGDEVMRVSTTHEANKVLLGLFPEGLNPAGRGRRAMLHNLQTDMLRAPELGTDELGRIDVPKDLQRRILDAVEAEDKKLEEEQRQKDAEQLEQLKKLGERPDGEEKDGT